jgi:hypothetical protein
MSIGHFFIIFFVILLGAVVWILRSPKSRPMPKEDMLEHQRREEEYWVYFNPAGPVRNGTNDN